MIKGLQIKTPPLDVFQQMAVDEIICDSLPEKFILRFYNWRETGITFGYSQRHKFVTDAVIKANKQNLQITRRPTGGGIVYHETDLTFSFIFHYPGESFKPVEIYKRIHSAINSEYARAGRKLNLLDKKETNYDINNPIMDCFQKPVDMDILCEGKKALGGALRKFGDYMLYQASLQIYKARDNSCFHEDIIAKAFSKEFNIDWIDTTLSEMQVETLEKLKQSKYLTDGWNKRI
ncbi:MAG: hypothetical protein U9Q34_02025 [Elusimicrobiota bacterium]|nr:hypothetical protein [Elusimicrobiota bacterium]